jgi:GNAT superfamily N-acetyltransferase
MEMGWLSPLLWCPPSREAVGIVLTEVNQRGRGIWGVYLEPPGPPQFSALLTDIEREGKGPIDVVTDALPGIGWDEQARVLEPLGFWHSAKVLMRRAQDAPMAAVPVERHVRELRGTDKEALVTVNARAYSDRPGEFWVRAVADPLADSRDYIGQLIDKNGTLAPDMLPYASFVWEQSGEVVGCVLVCDGGHGVPLISNLFVDPDHHRQGIGRTLILHALQALRERSSTPVEIVAIRGGAPYRLYGALDFAEVPAPEGRQDGYWVRGTLPAMLTPPPP